MKDFTLVRWRHMLASTLLLLLCSAGYLTARSQSEHLRSIDGKGVITLTTTKEVGEQIFLKILADGAISIEGVAESPHGDGSFSNYTLTSQTVVIRGTVKEISCEEMALTSLDISHNPALTKLYCGGNKLTSLDLTHNLALIKLYCGGNRLTSLDLSHNPVLTELYCYRNSLTSLELSHNPALTEVDCSINSLTSLDVSHNQVLTALDCEGNSLTSIDLSHNPTLVSFNARENDLTSLDLSHNQSLVVLVCQGNRIKGAAMTRLMKSLPDRQGKDSGKCIIVATDKLEKDNLCLKSDVSVAKKKNWVCYSWNENTKKEELYDGEDSSSETYPVTLASNEHGSIRVLESVDLAAVPQGTELTIIAEGSNPNCKLTKLTANGEDILSSKMFTVTEATEVRALFVDHTGVESLSPSSVRLYPNPSREFIFIEGCQPSTMVYLYSLKGELLYTGRTDVEGSLQIESVSLVEGVYLVCIADEVFRVVIEHS